jgi:hypothetical protein
MLSLRCRYVVAAVSRHRPLIAASGGRGPIVAAISCCAAHDDRLSRSTYTQPFLDGERVWLPDVVAVGFIDAVAGGSSV